MLQTIQSSALLPSASDVTFYREHGYYISEKILSDAEIDDAIYGSECYYAGERDFSLPPAARTFEGWKPGDGDGLRINDYVSLQNRHLFALVQNPLIGAIAARLTGSPQIRLWHDQLIYKPPGHLGDKTGIGWHTDHAYWQTCTSVEMLTAWIPLHDCDETMGPLVVIDGSHRWPDSRHLKNFHCNDAPRLPTQMLAGVNPVVPVPMNLKKGQVSFHHCLTVHGSMPNLSNRPRLSLSVHLQDADNRCQSATGDPGAPWHRNNVLCRSVGRYPDYTDPDFCPVLWSEH